jgi:hypothetical protein
MDKRVGIRRFTRLFEGTVFLENGRPVFDSSVVPEHGDEITTRMGSTLQVQRHGGKLVEKFIKGPARGERLPPNWGIREFNQDVD